MSEDTIPAAPGQTGPPRRTRLGPRAVSAIALTVLGACAATIVAMPVRQDNLRSLPNWQLAELLPTATEFPSDWNYGLAGLVHRTAPGHTPQSAPAPARDYVPPACRPTPVVAELDGGTGDAASVYVDRDQEEIRRAHFVGEENGDPHGQIVIWPVSDGAARIAEYVDWLHTCGRYTITSLDPLHHTPQTRAVTATVDSRPDVGSEAGLAFTRSSRQTAPKPGPAIVTRVTYYWVRGVLLEYSTTLSGADGDVMNRVVAQTLQKLRAA
jgi:hypothetical protein